MQEKSLIKKNILKFLDIKGISKYQLYKLTGITRGVLDQNNGMNEENTAKFLAVFGNEVSVDWLIRGIGEMAVKAGAGPVFYEKKPVDPDIVREESECIMAMKETISTQKKYINILEEENEKLRFQLEKCQPGESGQKRKAG